MMKPSAAKSFCKSVVCFLSCFFVVFNAYPNFSLASDVSLEMENPSSPNPVGSGARALGMGGAFIAVADDATAASWNPGGLIQLDRPEISFVGEAFHRIEDNAFGDLRGADGEQRVSESGINYLSLTSPSFEIWGRSMVVSLSYQHLYDFSREWKFSFSRESEGLSRHVDYDYQQSGRLSALGMACCVQLTRSFSAGFTLNIWDDDLSENEWEQRKSQKGTVSFGGTSRFEKQRLDRYSFSGFNANLGFLWRIDETLTVGAVLKTPFEADLKHDISTAITQPGKTSPDFIEMSVEGEMDMPMSCGIGVAYRFSDELTASLDIYRTEWDDFVIRDGSGRESSPITGKSLDESDIDPTHQVRLGAEYLIGAKNKVPLFWNIHEIPIRFGAFYDPAPASGSPDDIFGFAFGSGFATKRFAFDMAYQYRFGNDVGDHLMEEWEFSQDVREHTVYGSVILYF